MLLLEAAWPGPLQSGMALKAETINPAHYFLRASHPINNSFCLVSRLHTLLARPQLGARGRHPVADIPRLAVAAAPRCRAFEQPRVDSAG